MGRTVQDELEQIRAKGLFRSTRLIQGRQSARVTMEGRQLLLLCSNNYLGLAEHPALIAASMAAAEQFGSSSGASRLVSGSMEPHEALETAVAAFKRTESALAFNSGYAANTGIIQALVGRGDVIFCDRLNHASIIDGALLSGARLVRYPHNDAVALAGLMEKQRGTGRCLIVSDGVFSMDGDLAPLAELAELRRRHDALLMVDDAHGCGVLGEQGRGSAELLGVLSHIDIHVGTFGKALGSFGAYAALSRELRDLLVNRARSFIFSTSLPPAVLAVSTAALELVQAAEGDELRKRLRDNTSLFRGLLRDAGFFLGEGNTQIVPILTGGAEETMDFSRQLLEEGMFVQGIRPPTVPAGACRLRCTVMATHSPQDLTWAAERITHIGRRLGVV
ncbi:8-amino-7-oxononanoate synthase [Pelobacter propionicus]|uniref:8-amino-7-oxononanoate synthase n=1 Tax=Pelobacter propionicus (strain DSM 2379 / NBRC 103807 / OttBd1) TaxID=338966 RepID=BIOF_PELPD|nr:8-amino-7-oxononanoate synthase [Pelobacter propionicus]A1AQT1.1 RecName: Full=8-amino-7-oxononanoate synthase; Short=AONS; AltName: Full=7-keto-8-amino-pelargonic acid synthase; Short=7-KAP synthase; Short=KAPA synthase; AltName: Full=8-amino-7-ketopelargonate synthase [Pelobacter propionicus DSM 2379]ABK99701.1 8-amino-7-oxononanoate synthase [Pelobacter propionicus DSM 2379]